jgi:S-adenosylmethionine hydrolase
MVRLFLPLGVARVNFIPSMAVVTFTTDFGPADAYAGAMKGVVLSLAPDAVLVDISHAIPRHDIKAGALVLAQAAASFPPGSIHVAVVDPGVGGARSDLVVTAAGQAFVGPDNGLLSLAAHAPRRAYRIDNPQFRQKAVSPTFHGRDVFAVAAGRMAAGRSAREAGAELAEIRELPGLETSPLADHCHAEVVQVDGFGNLVTSLVAGRTDGRWRLTCGGRAFDMLGGRTFADAEVGQLVLYVGSAGRMEIAVREGSAAEALGAVGGTTVELRRLA